MSEPVRQSNSGGTSPMRDARLRFVQRTALFLFAFGAFSLALVSVLHALEPRPRPLNGILPPLLMLAFIVLTLRQWRHPESMVSSLWAGWAITLVGLATPAWWFTVQAWLGGERLVDLLPPIGAAFLPSVVVVALLARPRAALWATLVSWLLIATPILAYLFTHPAELWSPRGFDLLVALGPLALLVPALVPLLRGVEQRFHDLHREGERLQARAERDVLIGLYNRRAGERFLNTLLAHSRADAALILFDIDHFKRINDTYGHPAGDAVLVEVGRRCSALLGREDIFARWGGEEFLVVLPGAPGEAAGIVAERLRNAIAAQPIAPVGVVSASFGVTALRAEDTLAEVLQRADDALYRAKAEGRNRVVSV
ncbi:MAG TPA: GGDEF domain-containing protein [Arenimonas sp.]|nr:GGDEF domain-containing protein [Arenimonas sp.]